jgi:integrase
MCPVCGFEHVGRLFKRPKSRSGRRWVPVVGYARAALARHRVAQGIEKEVLGDDYSDHGLVFCGPDGVPLRPGDVTRTFDTLVHGCGLPVIRLHDTRHGACSLLLAGGVPLDLVQKILGHSSPEVTRKVYAHILRGATAQQVQAAMRLVDRHRDR